MTLFNQQPDRVPFCSVSLSNTFIQMSSRRLCYNHLNFILLPQMVESFILCFSKRKIAVKKGRTEVVTFGSPFTMCHNTKLRHFVSWSTVGGWKLDKLCRETVHGPLTMQTYYYYYTPETGEGWSVIVYWNMSNVYVLDPTAEVTVNILIT